MVLCNFCSAEQSQSEVESSHSRVLASHSPTQTQLRGDPRPSKERELSIIEEETRAESLRTQSLKTGPASPKSPGVATAQEKLPKERKPRPLKMSIPPQLQQQLRLLIRANHILHQHGLVDAFGHISVRHPLNKEQYIIATYDPGAPALVKNMSNFISYWVKDSTSVDPDAPQGYSERYIHGEILRRFPEVNCVVHSHSEHVIPFTVGLGVREPQPVRPIFHMAGFLGQGGASVFTMESLYGTARAPSEHNLLINNATLGAALAARLSLVNPVVLQHKHGFTTIGDSIEEAVYRAIYTQKNCKLLQRAIALAGDDAELVASSYLTAQEIKDCAIMNKKTLDKSFRLWLRLVQVTPLYENEEGEPEKGKVAGMNI